MAEKNAGDEIAMKREKWVVLALGLGMMAATAGWLTEMRMMHSLGAPGVKVGAVPDLR